MMIVNNSTMHSDSYQLTTSRLTSRLGANATLLAFPGSASPSESLAPRARGPMESSLCLVHLHNGFLWKTRVEKGPRDSIARCSRYMCTIQTDSRMADMQEYYGHVLCVAQLTYHAVSVISMCMHRLQSGPRCKGLRFSQSVCGGHGRTLSFSCNQEVSLISPCPL